MAKPTPVEQRSHGEPARRPGSLRRPRPRTARDAGRAGARGRGRCGLPGHGRHLHHRDDDECTLRRRAWTTPPRSWCGRDVRRSGSTPSVTRRSGATRCSSTRRSRGGATAASGPGVSPKTALAVGLKVDVDALPPLARRRDSQHGQRGPRRPRDDPGAAEAQRRRRRQGLLPADGQPALGRASSARCATRPSTTRSRPASATASTAGRTATSTSARSSSRRPTSQPVDELLGVPTWRPCGGPRRAGDPGKFDAELFLDGKAFRPDGKRPRR